MSGLKVSRTVSFPLDAVTQTFGILAKKRAGKSNAAVVIAEEMFDAGIPFVVIDPKGDWWGMRSSSDGKKPGLSIPVFGGEHGDIALEPTSGDLVATLIAEKGLTCILDVSDTRFTKAQQVRFLIDFFATLYRKNRDPLHVFLEEADEYIPQKVTGDFSMLVRQVEVLVKRGGFRGLGITMISQRSASINKDVLTQIDTLIVLQTTAPNDRDAVERWVEHHEQDSEIIQSLAKLGKGEAWLWSPVWLVEHGMPEVQRIQFRRRHTFDSGATPTLGKVRRATTLADIDLGEIEKRMAATIEKVKGEDPKHLKLRVRELERELAEVKRSAPEPEQVRVEVPVMREEDIQRMEAAVKDVVRGFEGVQAALMEVREIGGKIHGLALRYPERYPERNPRAVPVPGPTLPVSRPQSVPTARKVPSAVSGEVEGLGKAEKAILVALRRYPHGKAKRHLGQLAGYAWKGGSFNNSLSALNVRGLIQRGDPIRITEEGLAAIAGLEDDLPAPGNGLVAYWVDRLGKAERLILEALVSVYPKTMTKEEVAEVTGYEVKGGSFNNSLSRLRVLELIEGRGELKAADTLMVG